MQTNGNNRFRADAWPTSRPDKPKGFTSPVEKVLFYASELREYVEYYLSARADRLRYATRQLIIYGLIAVALLLATMIAGAMAVILLVLGTVGALSALLGWTWQAQLAVGGVLILLLAGGLFSGIKYRKEQDRRKTVEKYERRRKYQTSHFGHDAHRRAAPHAPA